MLVVKEDLKRVLENSLGQLILYCDESLKSIIRLQVEVMHKIMVM